ncbi:magnesium transporter [Vermiculatibacterium agrestimuris]|uniref:magnesium transporter n=1 Tax=Vermiculatibacterium agrestimuris TaxID=2941519 RepID=UPI0030B9B7A5
MENMEREDRLNQWQELLADKKLRELKAALTEANEVDAAEFMAELSPERTVLLFRMLPKEVASDVFTNLEPEKQETIISSITDREIAELVEELYVDDAVDMLEELPANVVTRVLKNASLGTRKVINQFLNYPDNSVGSIMTAEVTDLKKSMTVAQAIARVRAYSEDSESIYICYVTDNRRLLEGVITLRELMVAKDEELVGDLMSTDVIAARTTEDQEEAVQRIMKYDFLALPVVDQEGRLVGIVTVDDVMDVMEEEATEDIEKMAAITPTDKPYLKMTPFEIWKARIPWLMLLMISATFTGLIISSFESALARWVALTAFIPMLMDTGGNTGSQASVTVIRAISIGDLEFSDLPKVLWKELRVAVLCAVTLGAVNFLKIQLIDIGMLGNTNVTTAVALVVCLTLAFTVVCAKLVGCCLPMLAKKLGFDPAVMASPFITTIVDALSLVIYFQIANRLLGT